MDLHQRTLRFGLMTILFAAVLRISALDPAGVSDFFSRQFSFLNTYTETGQTVRFSPSYGTFSTQFVETPPPWIPPEPEPDIPSFTDPDAVALYYASSVSPDIGSLLSQPLEWDLHSREPTVLILHTHGTESYTKAGESYRESAAYRTLDEAYNMLSVGQLTADLLNMQGIPTLQDRQIHDYPSYNGAYADARKTVADYLAQYPSIRLILDLHRDASGESSAQLRTLAHTGGGPSAQLMIVLGTGHSRYPENLSLALKLHAQLESRDPGIMRPLQLRPQRFNQDLHPGMLLVEVGAAGNTRAEALCAARQLAGAITALARGTR